jgi:DNA-binding transcriptional ArsR family regulator
VSDASRFFAALGDETRLSIVRLLQRGERTVGELVEEIGCPKPKDSRHLNVFKDVGLARDRRDGRNIYYELAAPSAWGAEARRWVELLDVGLFESPAFEALPFAAAAAAPSASPRPKRLARSEARPDDRSPASQTDEAARTPTRTDADRSPAPAPRVPAGGRDMETFLL